MALLIYILCLLTINVVCAVLGFQRGRRSARNAQRVMG